MNSYAYSGFQVIGEYTTDSQHIKRRFIYAAGIDEPICMVVEPDHQGWYGLNEFSVIATSWLCDANDICYDANADYNTDDIIDLDDLFAFLSSNYYLEERPLLESTKYYGYVFDGTGSVVAITYRNDPNQTGNPNELPYFVETYAYDPFGTPTIHDPNGIEISQSAIGNPYMFTAREYDPESGLYYYRYRMYSPTLGRFMQTDPIGYYDSMNLYQYCGNNPENWIDPWGLRRDPILSIFGKIWNAPNTALGLVIGGAGMLLGGEAPHFGHNGINFTYCPLMPYGALTLGNVMLYGKYYKKQGDNTGTNYRAYNSLSTVGDHEEQHTYQGEVLGPFYLLLHLIDKAIWGYFNGPLERGPYSYPPRPWM